jgi:integrase
VNRGEQLGGKVAHSGHAAVRDKATTRGFHPTAIDALARWTPGLTVSDISKLRGHSSAAVTARYLDHLTNNRAIAALEAAELPELDDARPPSPRSRRRAT